MCYVRQPQFDKKLRGDELSVAQWLELASAAKEHGMVFLLLTGGEVFLRPDFFDIYTPLTSMGFILMLYTNGTLINESVAEKLAVTPPSQTEITLYGATAATYDAVTGVSGSYQRCVAGIELLIKKRIPLRLKSTLTKRNVGELEAMKKMACEWGIPFSASWLISKRRDGGNSATQECRIPATDCIALEANEPSSVEAWTKASLRKPSLNNDHNFYCQAGKTAFVVNPYGEMIPCVDLTLPAAHPLDVGFQLAWEQLYRFVDDSPSLDPACLACDVRIYCPRCPAWSAVENNTLTKPVPYLCEIAKARKQRFSANSSQ
ncbi:MAG: radical SAM protein [Chlorobium sp.]|nr:radical SAM protein [Chlorobium sp.]